MKLRDYQNGFAHVVGISIVVIIAVVGFVGLKVWDNRQSKSNSSKNSITKTSIDSYDSKKNTNEADYVIVSDWGVRFPKIKVGKFSYSLPISGQGATPELTQSGPSDMQFVYINVAGFTTDESNCLEKNGEVLGLGIIYRHKEQNPTMEYTTTYKLNPTAQVKIGDWYYSTKGLDGAGNCFNGKTLSADYVKLQNDYLENFKKLAEY